MGETDILVHMIWPQAGLRTGPESLTALRDFSATGGFLPCFRALLLTFDTLTLCAKTVFMMDGEPFS